MGRLGRWVFDRGIWAFGRYVERSINEAATSDDPSLAAHQKEREFERLMGGDMQDSTSGYADPATSGYARVESAGRGGETILASGY